MGNKRGIITNGALSCDSIDEFMPSDMSPPFAEEKVIEGIDEDGNEHDIPTGKKKVSPVEFQLPETKDNTLIKKCRAYQKNGDCKDWTYTEYERGSGTIMRTQSLPECTLTEMKPENKGTKDPKQSFVKFKLMPRAVEDIE